MNTHRMNITVPKEIASLLRDKPNKSAYITEALREKLAAEEKAKQALALAEAYRHAAKEEEKEMRDWDVASEDGL